MEMLLCLFPGLLLVRTASLGKWDSCSQRPLTVCSRSHHRFPTTFLPEGQVSGPTSGQSVPLGLAPEQTLGLSLPHSAGLGRVKGVGRATQTTGQWALAPG